MVTPERLKPMEGGTVWRLRQPGLVGVLRGGEESRELFSKGSPLKGRCNNPGKC